MKSKSNITKNDLIIAASCISLVVSSFAAIGAGGRERAKRTVCLANLKQLTAAWNLYADENNDTLVNGDTEEYGDFETQTLMYAPGGEHYRERPWVLRDWQHDATIVQKKIAIENGALFPYCKDIKLYKCPLVSLKTRLRSYTAVDAMNCKGWPNMGGVMLKTRSQIDRPSERFVFIDDGGYSLGGWTCYVKEDKWWDPPPISHNLGANFSFADGHSEYWKWKDSRTISVEYPFPPTQPGNEDIRRTQVAAWGAAAIRQ
jgi:prepilin-type processing-associated H-X9-DG protein